MGPRPNDAELNSLAQAPDEREFWGKPGGARWISAQAALKFGAALGLAGMSGSWRDTKSCIGVGEKEAPGGADFCKSKN